MDKNLQVFKILETAGVFDNDKTMLRQPTLPKSDSDKTKNKERKSFL